MKKALAFMIVIMIESCETSGSSDDTNTSKIVSMADCHSE